MKTSPAWEYGFLALRRLYEIFKRLQVTALEYRALGQVLAWEAKKGPKQAPKWRQAELVRKTAKTFFCRGIGVG